MRMLLILVFLGQCCLAEGQLNFDLPAKTINRSSAEVGVGDFDHDGQVDVAVCGAEQRWYKGPDFTTFYKLGNSNGGPYAGRVADINGDGWDDFITSDGSRTEADVELEDAELYVYLNPGGSGGDPTDLWTRIVIAVNKARHQNDMRIVDMDGDGRLDIIERTWATNERVVIAFQNADINSWTVKTYNTGETGLPEGISAGDVDGDGEMELVLSGEYWDNPGGWRSDDNYTRHTIDEAFLQEEVKSAVGDLDGDGDNDIYMGSAERTFRFLAWYENTGLDMDGAVIWTKHLIEDDQGDCHMIDLTDIDKDGDLDICTARSFGSSGMLIYYNDGVGNFTKQDFDSAAKMYTGVVADLDQDGDNDYIGPERFYGGKIRYYLNVTPGDPPATPGNLITTLNEGLEIQLAWMDLSANEGSFVIERKQGANWESLVTLPAETESYDDQSTEPGTSYQYRLYAANFAGNSDTLISDEIMTWSQVDAVTITPIAGNYSEAPMIEMSSSTPMSEIRYTQDGSTPSMSSNLYIAPFTLNESATIKARAFANQMIPSEVSVQMYNVAENGNFPPVADAGPDVQINGLITIMLDGSGSSDLDDPGSLSFLWTQVSGPSTVLINSSEEIASFTPTGAGVYIFNLKVEDEVSMDQDQVVITVSDLSENLVAYWPLDESEGNAIDLVSGNNAVPTTSGIGYLPNGGKVRGSFSFDGGNSTRLLAPSINVPSDEMTIAFWMKADNLSSVEGRMISKAGGSSGSDHYWMISLNGGSQLRFRLKTDSGGTATLISNTGEVEAAQWYFITAWYNGNDMKIFKNKVEIATLGKTGNISAALIPIAIGNQPPGAGERPFPGLIDDVRIYDKALSSAEIEDIYNESCPAYVLRENATLTLDETINSGNEIELRYVTLGDNITLTLKSIKATIGENVILGANSQLLLIPENGCQ